MAVVVQNHGLNSLTGVGYIGDYIGDHCRGTLGVYTIAHMRALGA